MIGKHCIKTWSTTQPTVTLSSGEAEFYGVVKASGIALGQQSLLRDLGIDLPVRVWTDSSAALGICSRSGLGKLRHLETHTLWVQEKIRTGAFELRKVKGDVNPADLFTKHLSSRERVHMLVGLFGCVYRDGRAESAPLLRPNFEGGSLFSSGPEGVEGEFEDREAMMFTEARVTIPDAMRHDERRLPHLHNAAEMSKFFPVITAPPEAVNVEDWTPTCSEPCMFASLYADTRSANKRTTLRQAVSHPANKTVVLAVSHLCSRCVVVDVRRAILCILASAKSANKTVMLTPLMFSCSLERSIFYC